MTEPKFTYRCPMCERTLSVSTGVVLVGSCRQRRTLLVLSPEPGNYGMEAADGQPLEPGTEWELTCPLCGEDLSVPVKRRLARLEMVSESGKVKLVMFSKTANEQATFVLGDGTVEPHGRDSKSYL